MDWSRGPIIGQGSSGTVSKAICHRNGDVFAVKSAELSRSELLQREHNFLSKLSSPFIVSYMGCDVTSERNTLMYNLKIEYAPAGTLTEAILRRGPLNESIIGYYTCQLVQGLEYLHSSGIVHCDIKGRNILLGEYGAKIADFGCARWINRDDRAAVSIGGTPMYMAPEVARGEEQGFAADIWSLGCTIIEMASSASPWPNVNDPISLLYKIGCSGQVPEFPDNLSPQAIDFLSKCLRVDPEDRWTAKQLATHPFLAKNVTCTIQNQEVKKTYSPTSVLDQGVWSTIEEEAENLVNARHWDSAKRRIGRLSLNSRLAEWRWDESWSMVRGGSNDDDEENCGSVTVGDDVEELESSCSNNVNVEEGEELILNFLGENYCCCRNSCNKMVMGCTCRRDCNGVVMSGCSVDFERHIKRILFK